MLLQKVPDALTLPDYQAHVDGGTWHRAGEKPQQPAIQHAVSGKTGVIPIVVVIALHFITTLVGALAHATRLDIATTRQKLMANMTFVSHPHSDIQMPVQ